MKKLFVLALLTFSILTFSQTCPEFKKEQSNPYYLLFTSTSPIEGSGSPLTINGLPFVNAGNWVSQSIYHASWSGTSGLPLNINNFEVTFGNLTCHYPSNVTLSASEVYLATPTNLNYKVYDMSGKLLQQGRTTKDLLKSLPKNINMLLVVEGMRPLKFRQ